MIGKHEGPHFTNKPRGRVENCDQYTDKIKEEKKIKKADHINYLLDIIHSISPGSKRMHSKVWKYCDVPVLLQINGFQLVYFFQLADLQKFPTEAGTPG